MSLPPELLEHVPLAPRTTLGVGGMARYWLSLSSVEALPRALDFANRQRLPIHVLGGGSNTLISDAGIDALVLSLTDDRMTVTPPASTRPAVDGQTVDFEAAAGVEWDRLVAATVDAGLSGIECLSGIPGWVGAAPIQNIGAYGQELADTLVAVDVVDMTNGEHRRIDAADCGFGYRHSHFKDRWRGRFLVASVQLRLKRSATSIARYGQLRERLDVEQPTPVQVRDAVLAIRAEKSMVLRPHDPNRRSAGSFFVNPVVGLDLADAIEEEYLRRGGKRSMPRFPVADAVADAVADLSDQIKLSAAWLIEEAGFGRGYGSGAAGLSSQHTLAVINRGGAKAADIVALASTIRRGVRDAFDVTLRPEPVFIGFDQTVDQLLG